MRIALTILLTLGIISGLGVAVRGRHRGRHGQAWCGPDRPVAEQPLPLGAGPSSPGPTR